MREHNPTPARKLSRAALTFRAFHAAIAVEMLLAMAYVWWCALSGRRDPVPLFELLLSPRAAKRAVPTLGAIAAAGLVLLVARGRRDAR
jgi:hypothetical protein